MHTHTSTRKKAESIKSTVDRLSGSSCEIIRDGALWRVSDSSVASTVFARVRDLIEAGHSPASIALEDVITIG